MPHQFIQCVRYSCKGVPHPFKDFPTSKVLVSIAASIEAFHYEDYEETLHSLQEITHYSPNRVYFQIYQFLVYPEKACGKSKDVQGMFHCSGTQ